MTSLKRPLFKWFGSKRSAVRHYPAPKFGTICEPFAGGADYFGQSENRCGICRKCVIPTDKGVK